MNQKILQFAVITVVLCCSLLIGINGCSTATVQQPTPQTPATQAQGQDIRVVSSINENHSHSVIIKWQDIVDANKSVTYTTTENGTPSHSHTLTLTAQNFEDIKLGKTITVTCDPPKPDVITVVSDHVHQFVIKK